MDVYPYNLMPIFKIITFLRSSRNVDLDLENVITYSKHALALVYIRKDFCDNAWKRYKYTDMKSKGTNQCF